MAFKYHFSNSGQSSLNYSVQKVLLARVAKRAMAGGAIRPRASGA